MSTESGPDRAAQAKRPTTRQTLFGRRRPSAPLFGLISHPLKGSQVVRVWSWPKGRFEEPKASQKLTTQFASGGRGAKDRERFENDSSAPVAASGRPCAKETAPNEAPRSYDGRREASRKNNTEPPPRPPPQSFLPPKQDKKKRDRQQNFQHRRERHLELKLTCRPSPGTIV